MPWWTAMATAMTVPVQVLSQSIVLHWAQAAVIGNKQGSEHHEFSDRRGVSYTETSDEFRPCFDSCGLPQYQLFQNAYKNAFCISSDVYCHHCNSMSLPLVFGQNVVNLCFHPMSIMIWLQLVWCIWMCFGNWGSILQKKTTHCSTWPAKAII